MLTRKRAAEADQPVETAALAHEPAATKKRAKNASPRYLCTACDTEKANRSFPDFNPSSDCEHLINTCKNCLKDWVGVQVDDSNFVKGKDRDSFGIRCPECSSTMAPEDVRDVATKTSLTKFNKAHRHHIGEVTPNWRWCMSAGCREGQVHVPQVPAISKPRRKAKGKKETQEDAVEADICTCQKCGAKACVPCDRPYHYGEDCETYQRRTKDRMDEEDKSLKEVGRISKNCPGCGTRIEKNGGCPAMYCTQCQKEFCWTCLQVTETPNFYCRCRPPPE